MTMYPVAFVETISKAICLDDITRMFGEMNNNDKGRFFEYFAEFFFKNDHRYTQHVSEYWRLENLPDAIRKLLGIPSNDIGIDGIIRTFDDEYLAVQVKFRSDINVVITWKELATFYGTAYGLTDKIKTCILFSNTIEACKYPANAKFRNHIFIMYDFINGMSEQTWRKIKEVVCDAEKVEKIVYTPRKYQCEILNKADEYFEENDKGRLYMACGSGKSLLSYWIALKSCIKVRPVVSRKICVLVPSLQLMSQIYETWAENFMGCKYLLIGSDAEIKEDYDSGLMLSTSVEEIKKYLIKYSKFNVVIISTYHSSSRLVEACKESKTEIDFCIYDEAHRTVGKVERDFSVMLTDEIVIKKRLFVTATDKAYKSNDDDTKVLSMDDEKIYGKIIHIYSMKTAIEDGTLTDYKIVAPVITGDIFKKLAIENKLVVDENISEKPLMFRYYMTSYLIIRAIKEYKINHMLTFNNINKDSKLFYGILTKMLKHEKIECETFYLTGESSMTKRNKTIRDFTKCEMAIICSARIFNEGVDIPIVDSICFVDNRNSTVDIVQSVGRPLRLHEKKIMAYIIIPTITDFKTKDDVLEGVDGDFAAVKSVLRAIGTTDERLVEEFILKNSGCGVGGNVRYVQDIRLIETYSDIKINTDQLDKSINTILCDRWSVVSYEKWKNILFEFVNKNGRVPSGREKVDNVSIGKWLNAQKMKLTDISCNTYIQLSTNPIVKAEIDRYLIDKQTPKLSFDEQKQILFEFVNKNGRVPLGKEKVDNVSIGSWLSKQKIKLTDISCNTYIQLSTNPTVKAEIDKYLAKQAKRSESKK